jgi:hypothetical protein
MTTDDQAFHDLRAAVEQLEASVNKNWRAPANKTVQVAIDDAMMIAKFVADCVLNDGFGYRIEELTRSSPGFVDSIRMIQRSFEEFGSCLIAVGKAGSKRESVLLVRLVEQARKLRVEAGSTVDLLAAVLDDSVVVANEKTANLPGAKEAVAEIRRQLQARSLLDEAAHALDQTIHARDAARQAAGAAGAAGVGGHYRDHAGKEARKADRLRVAVVALLVTVAVGFIVLNFVASEFTLASELLRLSATIPLAALAAYLMRESSKHRVSAQWAGELAIAMRSLEAYTQPLDAVERLELHRALGLRAFAATSNRAAGADAGLYDDLMTAVDALAKVEQLLQRVRDVKKQPEVDS